MSTSDPGTMPPPRTRLNSSPGTPTRVKFPFCTSVRGVGRLPVAPSVRGRDALPIVGVLTTDSTKVFHSPHSGQRPVHLGCSLPHCWQTNTVLVLDLGGIIT